MERRVEAWAWIEFKRSCGESDQLSFTRHSTSITHARGKV